MFTNGDSFLRWRWIGHRYGPDILPNCEFEFRYELEGRVSFNYRVDYRTRSRAFADRSGRQYVISQTNHGGDSVNDCSEISQMWVSDIQKEGEPTPSGEAPDNDTYFIDLDASFSQLNEYRFHSFTVTRSATFDLRLASDYAADAALIAASELPDFTAGRPFEGYGVFDNVFGTHPAITLGPGQYYAVVRNQVSGANTVRFEVDLQLTLDDYRWYDWYFSGARMLPANGGRLWQPFSMVTGARLFIDGCNSGLDTYVIPDSEIENFRNQREFRYYTAYGGSSRSFPGQWEIRLPPGSYWLVFRNNDATAHAVTWQAQRWVPRQTLAGGTAAGSRTATPLAPDLQLGIAR